MGARSDVPKGKLPSFARGALRPHFFVAGGRTTRISLSGMTLKIGEINRAALDRSRLLLEAFAAGDNLRVTETYLEIFDHFAITQYRELSSETLAALATFLKSFFAVLSEPAYVISDTHAVRVLQMNPVISLLTALSPFKTTDRFIRVIESQPNNYIKLLMLLNARSWIAPDMGLLFGVNPRVSSLWYAVYFFSAYGKIQRYIDNNIKNHVRNCPFELQYIPGISLEPMFASSYVDEINDRGVKERLNASVQVQLAGCKIENNPHPTSIAVISQRWIATSSVYKILRHFVHALRGGYKLTLVHLGAEALTSVDYEGFDEVRYVSMIKGGNIDLGQIQKNDFQLVFFPDIGMSEESVLLSNLRLGPIQCASYGHSVSTWGGKVDYWIGGRNAEPDVAPEANYSERLVLIPGSGGPPVVPDYRLRGPARDTTHVIANCPWGAYKMNPDIMEDLLWVQEEARLRGTHIVYRFFPGAAGGRLNNYILLNHDLASYFTAEGFEVMTDLKYEDYMAKMEEGHYMLDSYPFGGCNSVMDALWLRRPLVTRYGNEWNNRYGMALLKRLGLDEMAAATREEFRIKALRFAVDGNYREVMAGRIAEVDLINGSWDPGEAQSFRRAIDYLIEHHEQLHKEVVRAPIVID